MQSEDITKVDERHKKSCDHESLLFVYIDKKWMFKESLNKMRTKLKLVLVLNET